MEGHLFKYYIRTLGGVNTCADLADTGGPKFGKTCWCNTWTFPHLELSRAILGYLEISQAISGYLRISRIILGYLKLYILTIYGYLYQVQSSNVQLEAGESKLLLLENFPFFSFSLTLASLNLTDSQLSRESKIEPSVAKKLLIVEINDKLH